MKKLIQALAFLKAIEQKSSHIEKADDLFIGRGIYKS
jgi:hypothetical protein